MAYCIVHVCPCSGLGWRFGLQAMTGGIFSTFFLGTCYRSASLYHPQRRAILHLKNQKRKVSLTDKFIIFIEVILLYLSIVFPFMFLTTPSASWCVWWKRLIKTYKLSNQQRVFWYCTPLSNRIIINKKVIKVYSANISM